MPEHIWEPVEDKDLRHVWIRVANDDCEGDDTVYVSPDWYYENGTPICPSCGTDLCYSHTEQWTRRRSSFVIYSCGCVGLPPAPDRYAIIIKACDRSVGDGLFFVLRSMLKSDGSVKDYDPLCREAELALIAEINASVKDGEALQDLRSVLLRGMQMKEMSRTSTIQLGGHCNS